MLPALRLLPLLLACHCPPAQSRENSREGGRPTALEQLVAQEKRSPTTFKNVEQRFPALMDFVESTGMSGQYLPFETARSIDSLLVRREYKDAASLVRSAILNLEKAGKDKASQGEPPGPEGPPPLLPRQALARFVADEKKHPTTSRSVRPRFQALMGIVEPDARPGKYLNETAMRIWGLLDEGKLEQAAIHLHSLIVSLEPPPERQAAGSGSTRALERLVQEEKESPTTEDNLRARNDALYQALVDSRDPLRYVPPHAGELMQELIRQGRSAEAAARLREIILRIRLEKPAPSRDSGPAKPEEHPPEQRPAATDADKAGAAVLYFKAMQDYAKGKPANAISLLESGAKLDPDNQDIANALKRLRKER